MKKKSIQKLTLNKASISTLNANSLTGGTIGDSVYLCNSETFCETIDATRCYGNRVCGIFQLTLGNC
jgi:hypothetical protein